MKSENVFSLLVSCDILKQIKWKYDECLDIVGKKVSILEELEFEWDEDKNQKNLEKHGISFETAMLVFNDDYRLEVYDIEHSQTEDRYNTIGLVHDVLFEVYTERKEKLRIISARLATAQERSIYYDQDSYFK